MLYELPTNYYSSTVYACLKSILFIVFVVEGGYGCFIIDVAGLAVIPRLALGAETEIDDHFRVITVFRSSQSPYVIHCQLVVVILSSPITC